MEKYKYITSKLNNIVKIQDKVQISDNAGGFEINWVDKKTVYMQILKQEINQYIIGNKQINLTICQLICRYDKDININTRLQINSQNFIINGIIDVMHKKEIMEISCQQDIL